MTDPSIQPLTKGEADTLRARGSAGEMPSLESLRRFVATIRKSWLSKPDSQTKGKSRDKKAPPSEDQVDFF